VEENLNILDNFIDDSDIFDSFAEFVPPVATPLQELTSNIKREKWIRNAMLFDQLAAQQNGALSLWDATSNQFIYLSHKIRGITGYEPEDYKGINGLNFCLDKIHPSYRESTIKLLQMFYNYRMHPEYKYMQAGECSASIDFMFHKKDGSYFRNLQYFSEAETNSLGKPLMVLNYHFDVTHLKKVDTQTMVIKTPKLIYIFHFDLLNNKLIKINPLRKTELTVLSQLTSGKNTKEIALETFNSPHTIDTHRRNLLSKLNCQDTTALITYVKMIGIV
jgi:DNA-binding CsgD family transcriptional regulator/PAS domain-containing protein